MVNVLYYELLIFNAKLVVVIPSRDPLVCI